MDEEKRRQINKQKKEYYSRPDVKKYHLAFMNKYNKRKDIKAKRKEYNKNYYLKNKIKELLE